MASDRCGSGLRQGLGQRSDTGVLGFRQGGYRVGAKKWGVFGLKQGQRRDVRMQRRDFPEKKTTNVVTLRSNVATFQRVITTNVATLESHVATFQRVQKMTSRRCDPTSRSSRGGRIQRRDVVIQRRDIPEKCKTNVATLKANVATFQRRANPTSRRGDPTSRRSREGSN